MSNHDICYEHNYYKPRMYRQNARKDYLNLAKCKKRSKPYRQHKPTLYPTNRAGKGKSTGRVWSKAGYNYPQFHSFVYSCDECGLPGKVSFFALFDFEIFKVHF